MKNILNYTIFYNGLLKFYIHLILVDRKNIAFSTAWGIRIPILVEKQVKITLQYVEKLNVILFCGLVTVSV